MECLLGCFTMSQLTEDSIVNSGNIYNTAQLSQIISQVARIERLPATNSEVTVNILQEAWNAVDI
eukprot:COSAG02_NODE_1329_length_13218_cov_16.986432_11_plen_65_part_00